MTAGVFLLGIAIHPLVDAQPLAAEPGLALAGTYKQKLVKGVVSDETGQGLPGATVIEKGTTNGTVSDANGEYQLSVADDAVLVFSFIGYQTVEMPVGDRDVLGALPIPLSEVEKTGILQNYGY
ncbi:hypothetical protein GCM10009119_11060 [Algoriphagus jejuensis]|uniref:Carboxypeptidase-like protein n=1 Tax=Algoriphagus jejuensis TaxID=419934 RepID=A0ABP3YC06_9BACT